MDNEDSRRYIVPPNLRNPSVAFGMNLIEWLVAGCAGVVALLQLSLAGPINGLGWLILPVIVVAFCHRTMTDGIPTNVWGYLLGQLRWYTAPSIYKLEDRRDRP